MRGIAYDDVQKVDRDRAKAINQFLNALRPQGWASPRWH